MRFPSFFLKGIASPFFKVAMEWRVDNHTEINFQRAILPQDDIFDNLWLQDFLKIVVDQIDLLSGR